MRKLQRRIANWVTTTFGKECLNNRQERAARVLEEALELAQSEGLDTEFVMACATRVYARPAGDPVQEAAGIGVCLLAYGTAVHIDIKTTIKDEMRRVENLPADHFRKKQLAKSESGINIVTPYLKLPKSMRW